MFLLASDFDRTFYINNLDFKKNMELLPKFMEKNIFVIATGRSYDDYMNITKNSVPMQYLIVNHGATVIKDDKVIHSEYILDAIVEKLKGIIDFSNLEYFACSDKESRVDINYGNLSKINITMRDNLVAKRAVDYINEHFCDVKAYVLFHKNQFEIVSKRANKKDAIDFVANLENINKHNIYTVGDGYTDIEMVKNFNGFSVKDGVDELKGVASRIVDSVSDIFIYLSVDINFEPASLELTQFINKCFNHKHYFEKYMGKIYNDNNNSDNHIVIRKDNEIIATALLVPNKLYLENESLNVLTIGSVCVKEDYRGRGYFKMLMGLVNQEGLKYDISVLSGNKKLYSKYGFYPNLLSLYRVDAKDFMFEFKPLDEKIVDKCFELYNKNKVKLKRNKNTFLSLSKQWKCAPYGIYKQEKFLGYLFFNTKKNYISEFNVPNIKEVAASFANFNNREYINVNCLNNDYDKQMDLSDLPLSQTYNKHLYKINNFTKIIEQCLNYKLRYQKLEKGSLVIKIGKNTLKITVNNKVTVQKTDEKADLSLTYEQGMDILLNKKMTRNKLLSSWFYLDLDIYNNDLV